jgi:hypothetical protein
MLLCSRTANGDHNLNALNKCDTASKKSRDRKSENRGTNRPPLASNIIQSKPTAPSPWARTVRHSVISLRLRMPGLDLNGRVGLGLGVRDWWKKKGASCTPPLCQSTALEAAVPPPLPRCETLASMRPSRSLSGSNSLRNGSIFLSSSDRSLQ